MDSKHDRLFSVKEVVLLYQIAQTNINIKAKKCGFTKTLDNGKWKYLFTGKQIEKMLKIPSVSDSVIYVNTVWEIYPSKLNYTAKSYL